MRHECGPKRLLVCFENISGRGVHRLTLRSRYEQVMMVMHDV